MTRLLHSLTILVLMALLSAVTAAEQTDRPINPNLPAKSPTITSFDSNHPYLSQKPSLKLPEQTHNITSRQIFFKLISAVLIVCLLAAVLFYLTRKISTRSIITHNRQIQLIESLYLGPKKSVHLLSLADRKILIGCTQDSITRLAEIPADPDTDQSLSGKSQSD